MKGVYTAGIATSALAATRTLIYITSTASKVVEILAASVTNRSNETNEQLECCLQRITTLGTPTATAITPAKHEAGDQAATITAAGNVTASEPTYTADTQIGRRGWASLGGWYFDPVPEDRVYVAPSASIGLLILSSTFTALDLWSDITFREVG